MAVAGGRDRDVEHLAEVDGLGRGGRVAARQRLQAVEQRDEPGLLLERLARHLGPALGRLVGVARERGEARLDAGERGAQLVAGVGGEAAGGRHRTLAVGGRAAEPREHRVERRGQLARLRRPAVGRDAAVEVLLARDPRRRLAQTPQRAQDDAAGGEDGDGREEQRA